MTSSSIIKRFAILNSLLFLLLTFCTTSSTLQQTAADIDLYSLMLKDPQYFYNKMPVEADTTTWPGFIYQFPTTFIFEHYKDTSFDLNYSSTDTSLTFTMDLSRQSTDTILRSIQELSESDVLIIDSLGYLSSTTALPLPLPKNLKYWNRSSPIVMDNGSVTVKFSYDSSYQKYPSDFSKKSMAICNSKVGLLCYTDSIDNRSAYKAKSSYTNFFLSKIGNSKYADTSIMLIQEYFAKESLLQ